MQMLCLPLLLWTALQARGTNDLNTRYNTGCVRSACSDTPHKGGGNSPRHNLHTASKDALQTLEERSSLGRTHH